MESSERNSTFRIERSTIDEQRFGIVTARAILVTPQDLQTAQSFCADQAVQFLIVRCLTERLDVVHLMEQSGFLLMDTLVYYAFELTRKPIPGATNRVALRTATASDADATESVARASFADYFGHYHADSRLDRAAADEAYVSWARTAVETATPEDGAAPVLIAEHNGALVGFATLRVNSPSEGEGVLFGVMPEWQGQGIYRSFMVRFMEWCQLRGMTRAVVSTQITNLAVQRVWTRLGFEPMLTCYTFHKWF